MDPISLIIAAVVAGAASSASEVTSSAVRDLYDALKSKLKRRFGSPDIEKVQGELDAEHPDEASLREVLDRSGAASDTELIAQAKKLLAVYDPSGTKAGKYNVTVSGGVVGNIGDGNTANIGLPPRD